LERNQASPGTRTVERRGAAGREERKRENTMLKSVTVLEMEIPDASNNYYHIF
jgi:hypothetical protein